MWIAKLDTWYGVSLCRHITDARLYDVGRDGVIQRYIMLIDNIWCWTPDESDASYCLSDTEGILRDFVLLKVIIAVTGEGGGSGRVLELKAISL